MFCRCCHLNFGTISQIVVVYFSIEKFTVNWKLSIHWNMFEKSKEKLQRYSRRHNKNYAHASTYTKRRSSAVRTYLNVRGKGCAAHGTGRRSEASESPSPWLNCLLHLYVIVAYQNKLLSSNIRNVSSLYYSRLEEETAADIVFIPDFDSSVCCSSGSSRHCHLGPESRIACFVI